MQLCNTIPQILVEIVIGVISAGAMLGFVFVMTWISLHVRKWAEQEDSRD